MVILYESSGLMEAKEHNIILDTLYQCFINFHPSVVTEDLYIDTCVGMIFRTISQPKPQTITTTSFQIPLYPVHMWSRKVSGNWFWYMVEATVVQQPLKTGFDAVSFCDSVWLRTKDHLLVWLFAYARCLSVVRANINNNNKLTQNISVMLSNTHRAPTHTLCQQHLSSCALLLSSFFVFIFGRMCVHHNIASSH